MGDQRERSLVRQVGDLFRLTAQIVGGLDQDEPSAGPARRYSSSQRLKSYVEAVVSNSPLAVAMLDLDRHILACNPAFEQLFGYTQAEIVGGDLDALITSEAARPQAEAYTGQALQRMVHAVAQRRRKDGTLVEVEWFGIPVSIAGEPVGAAALYKDITERKRVEARLRLADAALDAAANAVVICDREGRITWVNPAFARLTGYTAAEAQGQTMRLLKSGQHDQAFYRQLWETIMAGAIWQAETTNRRKDGSLYVEEQTIAPVRDEQGEIRHFISIKQDVTARKQAEQALQRAREAAEAANQATSTLLDNMSHVLRTSLHYIIGSSQALLERSEAQGAAVPDLRTDIEKIDAAAKHLLGLWENAKGGQHGNL